MKALIISCFLFFNLNKTPKIKIIDQKTSETLVGVEVITNIGSLYSDLNGYVNLKSDEIIKEIHYISYKSKHCNFQAKDTIISLVSK